MSPIVVACAQPALAVGRPEQNLAAAQALVREAAGQGARLVVLPELLASGYVFTDAAEASRLAEDARTGSTATLLTSLARELDLVLVAGVCERDAADPPGVLRNSAVLVDASGVRAVYRKAHLWDAEPLVFTPGDEPPPVAETAVGRVALVVCYDLEFPEWIRLAALAGADVLCAPVNWPRSTWPDGERPGEVTRAQAAASTNHLWLLVADRCGAERGTDWVGGSVVVDPDGFPRARVDVGRADEASRPALLLAEIDVATARDKRISARNDVLGDRRPHLYGGVVSR